MKYFVFLMAIVFVQFTMKGCARVELEEYNSSKILPPANISDGEYVKTTITSHLNAEQDKWTNLMYCSTFQLAWNELKSFVG